MRMYVVGAGGMLGAFLVPYFESKGHDVMATDIDVNEQWLSRTDVRDLHAMHWDISNFNPGVIINLAAMTDLEVCESHAGDALHTNAGGSANCAVLAAKFDIPYVYISTAGIFDGKQEDYSDLGIPHPLCIYAKGKYWGEMIAQTYEKHIVLRCGWQMGSCAKDKKFIGKVMKQLKAGATELNVVQDKLGTPTYVKDFTLQIEKLLETESYGVYNAVCKGSASRYDVAVELVKLLGLQEKIKVNIVDSTFWNKEYWVERPASEKLITSKLDKMRFNVMRPWQEALAEYVSENPEYFKVNV
jgi:dTDP-4-dehydrorhamnose reductase